MANWQQNRIGKMRAVILILFACFVGSCFFFPRPVSKNFGLSLAETAPPEAATAEQPRRAARYTEFPHNVQAHRKDCNSCHKFPTANWNRVRQGESAFRDVTDYPKHESCLDCHRQQFFRGATPTICTICHTNPGPRNSNRHPFPNPREIFDQTAKGKRHVSDFAISFPHDKHIDIVSRNENLFEENQTGKSLGVSFVKARMNRPAAEESCAVCHQTYQPQGETDVEFVTKPPANIGDAFWLKKGTFKTSPISHAQCFTCHSQESGMKPAQTDCATCHKFKQNLIKTDFDAKLAAAMKITDKITLTAWRKRDSSATFRHEFSSHAEQSCSNCHTVATINTLDEKTKKVAVTSCSPCHITATSDDGGALNFEIDSRKTNAKFQCAKCHLSFGKSAVPASHVQAIAAQAGQ